MAAPAPTALTQLPLDEETRPRFNATELEEYLKVINLMPKYLASPVREDPAKAKTKQHGFPFLQALTRHHTCNVPFENLELHYSAHKRITLDVKELYDKVVLRRRGGRCMENNTLFGSLLRSFGYEVRNCGGRVARAMSPYPDVREKQSFTYDGWNHMLNLVQMDNEWYVVDVGMGSMGPNLPYPLKNGFETTSIAPRKIRLQKRSIAETFASQDPPKMWCYDVCHKFDDEGNDVWVPTYCFTETEFLPQDYQMMSHFTSTHESSFFTRYIMCTKMIMNEDEESIVGNRTLVDNVVLESIGAERTVIRECKTEAERLQALEEVFGVQLSDEEKDGISPDLKLGEHTPAS